MPFFLFFKEEKKLSKKPSGIKTTNIHYWEPSNPWKKNAIEGLTEEADQKKKLSKLAKTHHSHSWSPCFCTTDNTGNVINHFSSACAKEARELRKAPAGSWPNEKGIRASSGCCPEGKCNLKWEFSLRLFPPAVQSWMLLSAPRVKFPLQSSILVSGHCLTPLLLLPSSTLIKGEHTLKFTSWMNRGTANSRCSYRWKLLQLQGKSDAPTHIHRGHQSHSVALVLSSSSCSFFISPRGWGKRGIHLLSTVPKLFNSLRVCLQSWKLSWATGLKKFKVFGLYQVFKDKCTSLLASFTTKLGSM